MPRASPLKTKLYYATHYLVTYPSLFLLLVAGIFVAAFGKSPIHASSSSHKHVHMQHSQGMHGADQHDVAGTSALQDHMLGDGMAMPMFFVSVLCLAE